MAYTEYSGAIALDEPESLGLAIRRGSSPKAPLRRTGSLLLGDVEKRIEHATGTTVRHRAPGEAVLRTA